MRIRRSNSLCLVLGLSLATSLALPSCNNDSSSSSTPLTPQTVLDEVEPNDDATTAMPLPLTQPGAGEITSAGDLDWWSVALAAGDAIQIEMFGARVDQATWDTNTNIPQLAIYDTDGTTVLLQHDPLAVVSTNGWSWGNHDIDMPLFRAPAAGTYFVVVTGADVAFAGGDYAIRMSSVTLTNVQFEAEGDGVTGTNDVFGSAEAITAGTVIGFHVDDEADFYSFTTTAPTLVELEMVTYRNGVWAGDDDIYDPEIILYDTDGTTTLNSDDDTFFYDSGVQYWLETAGTYFVEVNECCGAGDARYFLKFNTIAADSPVLEVESNDTFGSAQAIAVDEVFDCDMTAIDEDFYAIDALAGDMLFVQLFDSRRRNDALGTVALTLLGTDGVTTMDFDSGSGLYTWSTMIQADGTYYIDTTSGNAVDTSYSMRVTLYRASGFEAEPNDDDTTAGNLDTTGFAAGAITVSGDQDWFSFTGTADELVTIACYADDSPTEANGFFEHSGWGSDLDPQLDIVDSLGATLATALCTAPSISTESCTDGLPTSAVTFRVPADGTYYVVVTSEGANFGASYYYALRMR